MPLIQTPDGLRDVINVQLPEGFFKMKLEVGKFYKTAKGTKARVYCLDGLNTYSVHGAMIVDGGWSICTWKQDGECRLGSEYDLVSEWSDFPEAPVRIFMRQNSYGARQEIEYHEACKTVAGHRVLTYQLTGDGIRNFK